ncbi:MAG TPA: hypothetical protein VIO61_01715 [Anaerolineaceae bacterium]
MTDDMVPDSGVGENQPPRQREDDEITISESATEYQPSEEQANVTLSPMDGGMSDAEMMALAESERRAELARAAVIRHVWTSEDTYASLAQKYYGSFQEPYWRLIYEHNKAIIGNHPNAIREGLEIEIPPLPDELKKK